MSKRRLTLQQSRRIANNLANVSALPGRVITCLGKMVHVETNDKTIIPCSVRATIDTIVPGDKVLWSFVSNETKGVIVSRSPRKTELVRPDKYKKLKPVAANVTQLIIVVAPRPEISWLLLDSYLVVAEYLSLNVVIVLNKVDLAHDSIKMHLQTIYAPLGYPIIEITKTNPDGIKALEPYLNHHTSVIVGQSGVGKSSIIHQLLPNETIATQAISDLVSLGKHTTTHAKLFHLEHGGDLIDSPGVREFALWHVDPQVICRGFKEFIPFLSQCKFRNCQHHSATDCGLYKGVAEGKIHPDRFSNFQKLYFARP